jgi:hypothetical protein
MDLRSMARLATASKAPLGRVGEILDQIYIEEQRQWRKAQIDSLTANMTMTLEEMQARHTFYSVWLCNELIQDSRLNNPKKIARLVAQPWRCTAPRASGRCRVTPHRFARSVGCPLHHHSGLPPQKTQNMQIALELAAADRRQKRQEQKEREDAEYSDALACYKRKEHDWQLAVVRDEAEYAQKSQRDEAEYAQKSQRDEAEYAQKSQRDSADDTEKRQLNMEQYKREMEQKKREMEQKKQKQQLEMKEIQAAHDDRSDIRRNASEEKTRRFQFEKSKFNTEVRLSIAEGTFSQEEGDQMMGKQRKRLFLSLGELMIREGLAGVKETTKFGQRFKQAYMDGFFSPKPLTDWVNGFPDVQNGQVTWYDEDLPKMREKAKQLIAEKAAEKAVASRGQSTLKVVARKVCLGGSPDSSVPSV